MNPKPPIFIELCAGTAALSLRLQGGPKAKPPVSRMGAKTGYADAILAVLGLYPGQGAESYLWCEPDDGVRGLLMAYPQPTVLRAAAAILRGWKDEEPRALWERLRAELKAGASVEGAEGVARWFTTAMWSYQRGEPMSGYNQAAADGSHRSASHHGGTAMKTTDLARFIVDVPSLPPTFIARDGRAVTPEEVARIVLSGVWSYKQMEPESGFVGPGDRFQDTSAQAVAAAVARMAQATWPPVTIVADGRVVTPEEVAAWAFLSNGAYRKGEIESGYDPTRSEERPATATGGRQPGLLEALPPRFEAIPPFPPVTLAADARDLTPPKLPPGVIVFCDPPYVGTTGYKHDLPRAEVVRMARLWADAGATVCISEAEPIPELMADGWHAVEISATRKGQKRTFSKQQAEWLTLSRPPSFVPRQTLDLFGAPL